VRPNSSPAANKGATRRMWIVRIALRQPVTIIVMVVLILLFGGRSILNTPKDMFPNIGIPVVAVVWTYNGLLPDEMSDRIVYYFERMVTVQVNNIQSLQSVSVIGYGVIKIFFQPSVNINQAVAQVTAAAQTVLKFLPAGTTIPYGGLNRSVQADLNLQAMQAHGVSPQDVTNALMAQNLIIPAGTEKIGRFEWHVRINSAPFVIDQLNDMPVKKVNGTVIYMRDIAFVHDGAPPQTNMVRVDGTRAVLMPIFKSGATSTLDIVAGVKGMLPLIQEAMPAGLNIHPLGDQSVFVKDSIVNVVREAITAAVLTGLMVLLFLGSWRLTVIIVATIPLAALCSVVAFSATGETINVMTLGGLALAVGMLVDAATVTLENISYHLEQGKDIETAILDGADQIVLPSFVSLVGICIVFVPMFQLTGVAHYLFVPLAEAVIYALLASFVLSISFVPLMARFLISGHHEGHEDHAHGAPRSRNPLVRFQKAFDRGFSRMREGYRSLLRRALSHSIVFMVGFLLVIGASLAVLSPWLGTIFFPDVDGGEILLHMSAPTGTRIEDTARLADRVEKVVRKTMRPGDITTIVDNIDIPYSPIDMAYQNTGTIGPEDADIMVQESEHHLPTANYVATLRQKLPTLFPSVTFSFLPADISTQILNFGSPAPIDVQVMGPDQKATYAYAIHLLKQIKHVPGVADVRILQRYNYPQLNIRVDRSLTSLVGMTQGDVARGLLDVLSGSFQVAPNFYLNIDTGVSYNLETMMPQYRIDSMADLYNLPMTHADPPGKMVPEDFRSLSAGGNAFDAAPGHTTPEVLGALASIDTEPSAVEVSHYNVQPVMDIYISRQGRDLGGINGDVQKIIRDAAHLRPPGSRVFVRGQVDTMATTYSQLFTGLIGAVLLIYLLISVNFQSWLDPFVIITALPGALAGIVWMLFITRTPLSVPALIGSIMTMGVASANSILVVAFARERLAAGVSAFEAAVEAGFTRLRPVLMTAGAMIVGMFPMAFGGTDPQNAPLGRAVIGGLAFATVSTLFFVPAVFSVVHGRRGHAGSLPQPAPVSD
jgi:multidrug efflux pump subunit AcrB